MKAKMIMIASAKQTGKAIHFPEAQLVEALTELWTDETAKMLDDPFAPKPKKTGTIYELLPSLDSLTIVKSLINIEQILEIDVPVTLVKLGGYDEHQEMLDDLIPKLRNLYEMKNF